jgi:choline dehydrogenase-like flavoprotein
MLGVLEHSFSRGSSRINSADPKAYPTIDPKYLSHPFDLTVHSAIALHLRGAASSAEKKPINSQLLFLNLRLLLMSPTE